MRQVLLLNGSYEPLRLLSLKRAVVLVLQEKAEIVEAGEEYVRSRSFSMPRPSVIRLKYFVKLPYRAKVALNRKALMQRDNGECQVVGCTRKGDTIDHIKPRSKGGIHDWLNVTLMCSKCNQRKSDRSLEELGWALKHAPFVPRQNLVLGIGSIDPAWAPHLVVA